MLRLFTILLSFLLITFSGIVNAQTKGLIYKPAGTGKSVLDPNLDGYTSSDTNGFIADDESESEIPYTPLPTVGAASEPDSDLGPGPSCGFTDLVKSDDNHTIYTYMDASNNLMFRFRLGGTANNSKGYSILIDTDQKFGATGANADPNYTVGNPGFEIEVVLRTNFGVGLYNVDGTTTPVEIGDATVDRPYDDYVHKSIAYSEICFDDDYFYDFYIPFADITAAFPSVTTSTPLRMVGQTVINPNAGMGNNGISDLGGIDDELGVTDDLWEDLIDVFPPTSPDDIGSGKTIPPRAECPTISGPISVGATSVSGTSSEVNGATIEVFRDGVSDGTTTVSGGSWSMTIGSAVANEVFSAAASVSEATASATGTKEKSTSYTDCNETTVGVSCSATISAGTTFSISAKGLCGDAGSAASGAEIKVYYEGSLLTPGSGSSNYAGGQVFANADGSWEWKCNTSTGCNAGSGCGFATAGFYEITQKESGKCESDRLAYCAGAAASSSAPVFTADPTTVSTSIDGTATAGASITWYLDDTEQATITAAGGVWSFTVSGLTAGQVVKIRSIENGLCSAETSKTVVAQSQAPIIQGNYCAPAASNITEVSGLTASGSGTTVEIFTSSATGGPYTTTGSTVVTTGASWTVTGLSIPVGDFIVATATGSGEIESDYSNEVEVFSQTVDASLAITTSPITEGDDAFSGSSSLADGSPIYLYLDGFKVDGFTGSVTSGTWTITGLSAANAGYDVLYAGATVTVTSQSGSLCESNQSAGVTVQCNPPTSQTFSATTSTQVCETETIDFQLNGTESLVVYELIDQSGNTVGPSILGDGSTASLSTSSLASSVTSITIKAQRVGITCETTFTPAVSVDIKPQPTISLTDNTLRVCQGTTSVDLGYTVDTNGPAVDYSIDFDAAANSAGLVDVTNNSSVSSPISIAVPAGIAPGTYNGSFTIRNSNALLCTSDIEAFTITVIAPAYVGTNPTTCAGSDGFITISGLEVSTGYTLNYEKDGTSATPVAFTSDGSGEYDLTGLNAGSYSEFTLDIAGCTVSGPVTLSDPGGSVISEGTHTQPTNCSSPNGEIELLLSGVTTGTFDVNFSKDGTPQGTQTISASASTITIQNLDEGSYTNISITNQADNCKSNTIAGPINLSNSSSPTITLGSSPSVSQGTTSADLSYTGTTNSPNQYTIDYDATAEGEGFVDVTTTALPASSISLSVPGAATIATYNGAITVINSGTGCSSTPVAFTVTITGGDTTPPVISISTIAGDDIINGTEDDSDLTISGSTDAEDGQTVTVSVNGKTYTGTAGSGSWSVTVPAVDVQAFDGSEAVTADVDDLAGNSATTANKNITYDPTPPTTPTVVSQTTNDTTPIITGTFDSSDAAVFTVTVDGTTYTLGTDAELTNSGDNWTLDLSSITALTAGTYPVTATITDAAGNTATDATINELVIDTTDPATPTVVSQTTNDTTPIVTGTFDSSDAAVFTVTVDGTTYTLGTDAELTNSGDNWTLDLSSITALTAGTYPVTATITDAAGNTATDATINELVIDTTDPATPTVVSQTTNDTTPIVTGTFDSSDAAVFTVTVDGTTYTLGTDAELTNSGDNWTLDLSSITALTAGTYPVTATITDAAGNTATDATINELVIDTTDPATPTVVSQTTNDTTPIITGTFDSSDAAVFTVTVDGTTYTLGTDAELTNSGDNWTLDLSSITALTAGTYPVTATITDAAGNAVSDATTNELVIDTTAPATPTVVSQTTNDTTPIITGTFDSSDAAVFTVTVDGTTYTLGTDAELTNSGDNWTLDLSSITALTAGTYPVTATITDAAGNTATDATINELVIDTTDPATPTVVSQTTNDTTPIITGTFDSSDAAVFTVTVDGTTYTLGTDAELTNSGDNWTLDLSSITALTAGTYPVTATITDAAGNTATDATINELVIDTTDPATPTVVSQTTNDTTPIITGTFDSSDAAVFTVTVDGTTYTLGTDAELTNSGDNWTLDLSSITALTAGTYPVTATITDAAGNTATDATINELVIDTTDPATPTVVSQTTNDTTPIITGTFDSSDAAVFTVTVDGTTYTLGTDAELTNSGDNWTLDLSSITALTAGTYPVTATITDAAGNTATDATINELVIDTTAPATPTVVSQTTNDTTPIITGTFDSSDAAVFTVTVDGTTYTLGTDAELTNSGDNWTLDLSSITALTAGTYPVTATITDAAGNTATDATINELVIDTTDPATPTVVSQTTNDTTPIVTGTFDSSDAAVFTVTVDGTTYTLGTDAELTNSGDNWTLDLSSITALTAGTYPVTATITDAAGNTATDATINELVIDTTDPATPTVVSQTTNDTTPIITGTFDSSDAAVFTVTVDGTTYTLGTDAELTNSGDNWTLDLSSITALTAGTYPVTATITDAAGNAVSDATTNELVIDTTAPATPTVVSQTTNDTTPIITGTFDSSDAAVFTVTVDGTTYTLGTDAELTNSGDNWTLDLSSITALTAGTYPVTATITDAAGNTATDATINELVIDTTDPATPTVVSQTTNDTTPIITGTFDSSDAAVFTVTVDGTTYTLGTDAELTNSGDNWTLDLSSITALTAGTYPVTATITDAAGNTATDATINELVIDTTDPATPTVVSQTTNDTTPIITGTFDSSDAAVFTVTVDGTTYTLGTDAELTNSGDNWTLDLSSITALTAGTYPVTATITDAAGNTATDATINELVIDTTDPATPTVVSQTTNDTTPIITGTFDSSDAAVFTVTVDGTTYTLGTDAELTNSGDNWTLDLSSITALTAGTYPVTATITDAAGNTATDATINELVIDTTDPATPTVVSQTTNDTTPIVTGTFDSSDAAVFTVTVDGTTYTLGTDAELTNSGDNWTLDLSSITALTAGTYPVTATITDAAGNTATDATINELVIDTTAPATPTVVSQTTNDTTPIITGTFDSSDAAVFTVTVDGTTYTLGTDAELTNSGDNWTLDLSSITALTAGTYPVTATITDAAGNTATDATINELVIDTTDPATPTVVSQTTNDQSPVLQGTAEAGSTVTVVINGVTFETTADGSGNWTIDTETATPTAGGPFTNLGEGTYDVSVTSTDAAGNSTTDAATDELVIDTTAPIAPKVDSQTTFDITPVITGTAEAGSTLQIVVGGATYSVIADASGNWSVDTETSTPISGVFNPNVNGSNEIVVTSTDAAGNSQTDTSTLELTILSGDSDGDGVSDEDEDVDGDGDPTNDDSDGDGTPDYLDEDDDGDGATTEDEDTDGDGDPTNDDCDNDGTPDYLDADPCDTDGDGILDGDEDTDGDGDPSNDDCDNDGTPNYLDADPCDTDGDGITDDDEDTDGDGNPYNDDCDGDGIPNFLDTDVCDTDGDGITDGDEDTDGDGNPYNDDCDGDGVPNFLDTDACDTDGDGITDDDEDTDGDGNPYNDDCDGDGVPNFLDTDTCDTDGDGITDDDEDTDGDGNPYNDDCDGDGVPNFLDSDTCDTDGDGITDDDEDTDGDGNPYNDDCDGDGVPNFLDTDACDTDGDGITDDDEDTDGDGNPYNDDCDGDGVPNFLDTDACDTDGDGISDDDEDTDGDGNPYNDDCDGDGVPNFLDTDACDTDGDGITDDDEDTDGDGNPYNDDCDGDGVPNFLDTDTCDTDGDGILDDDEDTDGDGDLSDDDCDEDGIPNYLDTDICKKVTPRKGFTPDGDGVNDFFYINDIDLYPNNVVQIYNRWGNLVFEIQGYDNQSRFWSSEVTRGLAYGQKVVPDGTYYYLIDLGDGSEPITGFVVVNR